MNADMPGIRDSSLFSQTFEYLYGIETRGPTASEHVDYDFIEPEHDRKVALQILVPSLTDQVLSDEQHLPLADDRVKQAAGPIDDYRIIWQNKSGSVAYFQEPSRFLFQTPQDGGEFISFAASAVLNPDETLTFRALLIGSDQSNIVDALKPLNIPHEWKSTELPMIVLPVELLEHHVNISYSQLSNLITRVESVEESVTSGSDLTDFNLLIRALHLCNSDLIKLERRLHFESKLGETIVAFIDRYKKISSNRQDVTFQSCNFIPGRDSQVQINFANDGTLNDSLGSSSIQNEKYFKLLDNQAMLQTRRHNTLEYDLSVLPRRIQNQFTSVCQPLYSQVLSQNHSDSGFEVFNLIAQRDTKATIALADESSRIAAATLRDSASMKTIAIMTLVFLPATFVCAFFSMSFFNWEDRPDGAVRESLWIFFAVALPLTVIVILIWILCTKINRESPRWSYVLRRRKTNTMSSQA